jgi:RES domain-containing protein
VKLGRAVRAQLFDLITQASPLKGNFFRSVAFRYFHPDDVISGEGTRLHGGRFVPVGVPAVYVSLDEETALREVTARKQSLRGRSQIDLRDYPRMTYVIGIATKRNLDLTGALPTELGNVVRRCLRADGRPASQKLAAIWIADGIESIVFPSATCSGGECGGVSKQFTSGQCGRPQPCGSSGCPTSPVSCTFLCCRQVPDQPPHRCPPAANITRSWRVKAP